MNRMNVTTIVRMTVAAITAQDGVPELRGVCSSFMLPPIAADHSAQIKGRE